MSDEKALEDYFQQEYVEAEATTLSPCPSCKRIKQRNHSCLSCGASDEVEKLDMTDMKSLERAFVCDAVAMSASLQKLLMGRPYKCEYCGSSFIKATNCPSCGGARNKVAKI